MGHVQGMLNPVTRLARSWLEACGCQQTIAVILAGLQIPQTFDIFLWLLPWKTSFPSWQYEYCQSIDHPLQMQFGFTFGWHCGDLAALKTINSPQKPVWTPLIGGKGWRKDTFSFKKHYK